VNAAEITALCTGIPAIIGAVTALVIALQAKGTAGATMKAWVAHVTSGDHDVRPTGDM
jgi:hypothetical protein